MSLTQLIRTDPALRDLLKAAIVKPRFTRPPLLVPPATKRNNLTGTAFDYLLRFEVSRRHPEVPVEEGWWVADLARPVPQPRKSSAFLKEAHQEVERFIRGESDIARIASLCTVLAKFDFVYRAGWQDPQWLRPVPEIAEELLALHAAVPFEHFVARERVVLNPTFAQGSALVGGADADLLLDTRLIDINTVQDASLSLDELRQLAGYAALAQLGVISVPDSPASERELGGQVTSVGLYYARHGTLVEYPVSELLRPEQWDAVLDHFRSL